MMNYLQRFDDVLPRATASGIHIVVAEQPVRLDELTSGEYARYHQLATAKRQDAWLRGRAVLKTLLRRLGDSPDTAKLSFPHPRLSLTHSGIYAIAAGMAHNRLFGGIGVDLELQPTMHPESGRFFLTEEEQGWITQCSAHRKARILLRLWTIKEAVFKADVENEGRILGEYRLASPWAHHGAASVTDLRGCRVFHYTSVEFQQGFLSVAVRRDKEAAPWSTS